MIACALSVVCRVGCGVGIGVDVGVGMAVGVGVAVAVGVAVDAGVAIGSRAGSEEHTTPKVSTTIRTSIGRNFICCISNLGNEYHFR